MVWEGRTGGKGHPAKIDAENILKIRLVVFITERHNPPPPVTGISYSKNRKFVLTFLIHHRS